MTAWMRTDRLMSMPWFWAGQVQTNSVPEADSHISRKTAYLRSKARIFATIWFSECHCLHLFVSLSGDFFAYESFNVNWNAFFLSSSLTAEEEAYTNQRCFNKHGNSFLNKQHTSVPRSSQTETLLQLLCATSPPKLQQQQSNQQEREVITYSRPVSFWTNTQITSSLRRRNAQTLRS